MKLIQEIEKGLNAVGLSGVSLFIGFVGAVIAQIKSERKPLYLHLVLAIAGCLAAAYAAPAVNHFLGVNDPKAQNGVVFLVGLLGRDLLSFAVRTIQFLSKNQELLLELKNRFKPGR